MEIPDFHRTFLNDESLNRGAARLLWAGITVSFPTKIADVINMSLYDAAAGWNELGATKNGVNISFNNTEETLDVDQIYSVIATTPTEWECSVETTLSETTSDRLALAWEGGPVTTDATPPSGAEKNVTFGTPRSYTQRRLAVLFPRNSGKIRAYIFRIVQRSPQDSTISFNKTGDQTVIPIRFNCLPDLSISDEKSRLFVIRDQV